MEYTLSNTEIRHTTELQRIRTMSYDSSEVKLNDEGGMPGYGNCREHVFFL